MPSGFVMYACLVVSVVLRSVDAILPEPLASDAVDGREKDAGPSSA